MARGWSWLFTICFTPYGMLTMHASSPVSPLTPPVPQVTSSPTFHVQPSMPHPTQLAPVLPQNPIIQPPTVDIKYKELKTIMTI